MAIFIKNDNLKIYVDKSGFGSEATALTDSKKKDQSITMKDVEEFFKKNVEQKSNYEAGIHFIAPHPYFEFQLDLCFYK